MNLLAYPSGLRALSDLDPTLRELAGRGHRVELCLRPGDREAGSALLEPIREAWPQVEAVALRPRTGRWWPLADASRRRERRGAGGRLFERILPADPGLVRFLRRSAPDLLLLLTGETAEPVVEDLIKAARHLAVRTALADLSPGGSSARVRAVAPDLTLDWSDGRDGDPAAAARRLAGALEAAMDEPARPWRTLPGAAPLRAALWPFVRAERRRILERDHPDMGPGIERLEAPRYASPRGGPAGRFLREIDAATGETAKALAALARSDRPILVGPWTGPAEIELLYWIPFLRWARQAYDIAPERFVVVSRGGVSDWYGSLAAFYLDLDPPAGDAPAPDRAAVARQACAEVQELFGLGRMDRLGPEVMLEGVLKHHWEQRSSLDHLLLHSVFEPMRAPTAGLLEDRLPDDYVAVSFEAGSRFGDTPANRKLVRRLLERLAQRSDVVLIEPLRRQGAARPSWLRDDLGDGRFANRLMLTDGWATAANELEVQTRIVARSRGFVGSFGSLSFLAPFLGKPSVSFHDAEGDLCTADVNAAATVFRSFGVPFVLLTASEFGLASELI